MLTLFDKVFVQPNAFFDMLIAQGFEYSGYNISDAIFCANFVTIRHPPLPSLMDAARFANLFDRKLRDSNR